MSIHRGLRLSEKFAVTILSFSYGVVALFFTAPVRAAELEDFQRARSAYQAHDYQMAAQILERVLRSDTARRSRPVRVESLKYLAAAYLFLGKSKEAEQQFEELLREDERYELDPVAFPAEVQQLFASVRERLRGQRSSGPVASSNEAPPSSSRLILPENVRGMLMTEIVERRNSRWVAAVPFGVGQFQNGDQEAGAAFAISQGALAIASTTMFFLHASLRDAHPADNDRDKANRIESAYRITNWVSLALLGVSMVAGIVHAQVRFRPVIRETRPRPLSPEVQELLEGRQVSSVRARRSSQ